MITWFVSRAMFVVVEMSRAMFVVVEMLSAVEVLCVMSGELVAGEFESLPAEGNTSTVDVGSEHTSS